MATIQANLAGLYKQVYSDKIIQLVPDMAKLTKEIEFAKKKKLGDEYHQPVVLADEQGFTYSNQDSAFELNDSVSMVMKDAKLKGSQIAMRYRISQNTAARAVKGGTEAFASATQLQYENVMKSFGKRLEIELLYGSTALAVASAIGNTSATTTTVTVSAAEWAIGIWSGMEGAKFNMYDGTSLVSSGADAVFTLTSVNLETRQLLFTGTSTGTTALQAVSPVTDLSVWFLNSYGEQMAGLKKIFTNTGTLFNINAADYNLWKTPNVTVTGALTFQTIINAMAAPVGRGLTGEVKAYISPSQWALLANDAAALRVVDSTYKSTEINLGTQEITYYYQGGAIKIVSHLYVKNGDVFIFPPKSFKRLGSTEITSATPNIKGATSDMFYMLPNNMGYESRMYTDQALFCETPAHCLYLSGFTVS